MLRLQNISKSYGENVVLADCILTVGKGEVVGLVGKNGAGKSTLFQIVTGALVPDSGSVYHDDVIGYLPQNLDMDDMTIAEYLQKSNKQEYEADIACRTIGLELYDRSQKMSSLSGGEKTKLCLVRIMLTDPYPTMLVLDEPTNNLDLRSILRLEEYITSFDGSVLLTSHDRQFLDEVADRIVELDEGILANYGGNYSFYREQKSLEEAAYLRKYEAQQKHMAKIKKDVERLEVRARVGEKQFGSGMPYQRRKIRKSAQQMASRRQRLQQFLQSGEALSKPEEAVSSCIHLSGNTPAGKMTLYVSHLSRSFAGKQVIEDFNLVLTGAEHVWLSGINGSGKSTLLKIIAGELTPDSGTVEAGARVKVGYYSQERDDLRLGSSILDELTSIGLTSTESYKVAINFHFKRDDLTKKISELSIGQRAKVSFAKLTTGDYQLLLLDEPTNHLEIETREVIESALRNFQGALLVASHDRYFLEQIEVDREVRMI